MKETTRELEYDQDDAYDAYVMNCSTRHTGTYHVPGNGYSNGDCIGSTECINPADLLDNLQNDTHTLTHMLMSLICIAQDMRDSYLRNTQPACTNNRHSDGKPYRIVVTFDSPDMTQEIGSSEVDEDGNHIMGVNLDINRIDKRIDIVGALEDIIETIKSTPKDGR